ncbi:MAG: ABC transporter ATP-binding protein [Candidatus Promineifilaceae bacterium]|nr:ABC transporter ATP-binding protein [Anaerolineaceae bacterium]
MIVKLENVTKNFTVGDEEILVLRGIDLEIAAGEFVAIVGPSGNGKSTLLNMITGIDHPTSGSVVVNGRSLPNLSENELAAWRGQALGIVFQFFQLLPALSLLQNVMLPMDFARTLPPAQRRERGLHLLEMVGLSDQAHKLPGAVSGGQQQRAAIARALANDPPLIVADEPTGNLDVQTSTAVFDLFSHLIDQGKTLLMVTHDKTLANQAQRVVEIVNGRIAQDTRLQPAAKLAPELAEIA